MGHVVESAISRLAQGPAARVRSRSHRVVLCYGRQPMPPTPERTTRLRVVAAMVGILVSVLVVACSAGEGGDAVDTDGALVRYVRVWDDGFTEEQTIEPDGRVLMQHGDTLERLTLEPDELDSIREALEREIPTGTPDDRPQRTLILADGTVIDAPRPEPGTITQLMDQLMDSHSLG